MTRQDGDAADRGCGLAGGSAGEPAVKPFGEPFGKPAGGQDILCAEEIRAALLPRFARSEIVVKQTAGSTNDEAKLLAARGAGHGTIVAAEGQTGGRGRYARGFYSPPGTGLYMSLILKTDIQSACAPLITIAAAMAVCRAIADLTGFSPEIKWVNDIFLHGAKVCGILTESASDPESGALSHAVVGIGLNVSAPADGFPPELRGKAGALYLEYKPDTGMHSQSACNAIATRNALAARIANELLCICEGQGIAAREYMDEYRARSLVLGKEISYTRGNERGYGIACGIDSDGRLLVRQKEGGIPIALDSGEVSIVVASG